jgi:hypothetical protein
MFITEYETNRKHPVYLKDSEGEDRSHRTRVVLTAQNPTFSLEVPAAKVQSVLGLEVEVRTILKCQIERLRIRFSP